MGHTDALASGQTPLEGMFGASHWAMLQMHSCVFPAALGLRRSLRAFFGCSEQALPANGRVRASHRWFLSSQSVGTRHVAFSRCGSWGSCGS